MIDVEKVIKGLECCDDTTIDTLKCDECPYSEGDTCFFVGKLHADALELIKKLWRDMNYVRSCSECRWRDEKNCSADADDDSVAFKRWRDCYTIGYKSKWEWDSEWE